GERGEIAKLPEFHPIMVRRDSLDEFAIVAEAMEMAVADCTPVDELDPQLEAALGRAHELAFVDPQETVEDLHQRDSGFANSDNSDFFGLDKPHPDLACREQPRERGCRHPPGGSPADDQDVANPVVGHGPTLLHPPGCGQKKGATGAAP